MHTLMSRVAAARKIWAVEVAHGEDQNALVCIQLHDLLCMMAVVEVRDEGHPQEEEEGVEDS